MSDGGRSGPSIVRGPVGHRLPENEDRALGVVKDRMGIGSDGSPQDPLALAADDEEGGAAGGVEERPRNGTVLREELADGHVRSLCPGAVSGPHQETTGRSLAASDLVGRGIMRSDDVDDHQVRSRSTGEVTGNTQRARGPGRVHPHDDARFRVLIKRDDSNGAGGRRREFQAYGSHQESHKAPDPAAAKNQHPRIIRDSSEVARGESVQEAAPDPESGRHGQRLSFALNKDCLRLLLQPASGYAFDGSKVFGQQRPQ